jgi:hypothetical protein
MKQINIKKEVIIGFFIGLLATAIGFYFYTQIIHHYSFKFVKVLIKEEGMLATFLTYAAIPNLLAFFVFIKRSEDYKARGVLLATFFIAIVSLVSKFV